MDFKLDENLPAELAGMLRALVLGREPLDQQLWTVDEGGVRVRGGAAMDW